MILPFFQSVSVLGMVLAGFVPGKLLQRTDRVVQVVLSAVVLRQFYREARLSDGEVAQ